MYIDERLGDLIQSTNSPNTYHNTTSFEYKYWVRTLLQKLWDAVLFDGVPEEWGGEIFDFFKLCLFARGYVVVFSDEAYGTVFQPCTLNGFNFYYQPTEALVSNPALSKTVILGTDGELIRLTPDYMGIWDIIDYYADKLAEISKAIDMAIINAKIPCVLSADNEAQAETLKKVYDKVQNGESLVIMKDEIYNDEIIPSKDMFNIWDREHLKDTYLTHDLLQDLKTLLDNFYQEIGIPVSTYEKKERLVSDEANISVMQSQARAATWIDCLNASFEKVNKMFGTNLSADLINANEEGDPDESEIDANRDRDVSEQQ